MAFSREPSIARSTFFHIHLIGERKGTSIPFIITLFTTRVSLMTKNFQLVSLLLISTEVLGDFAAVVEVRALYLDSVLRSIKRPCSDTRGRGVIRDSCEVSITLQDKVIKAETREVLRGLVGMKAKFLIMVIYLGP